MNLTQAVFASRLLDNPINCGADWTWSLPLIVVNVVIHVSGPRSHRPEGSSRYYWSPYTPPPTLGFALIMGATTLLATLMHGMEVAIWAVAYRLLDAMRDNKTAVLYSLNAMTSYAGGARRDPGSSTDPLLSTGLRRSNQDYSRRNHTRAISPLSHFVFNMSTRVNT